MRTTLTLDEDVAAKLKAEAARSGRSFKETVNETLRRGLATRPRRRDRRPFRVVTRDLGRLHRGLSLDNVGELLEQVEGPLHR
jgi:plasmid stability protein